MEEDLEQPDVQEKKVMKEQKVIMEQEGQEKVNKVWMIDKKDQETQKQKKEQEEVDEEEEEHGSSTGSAQQGYRNSPHVRSCCRC